jgi:chromosome segregation ATPase
MTKYKNTTAQKSKTIQELSKEFPEKTYRQLERYRDADRNEEAQRIITQQENEELKADQGKEIDYHRYWKKRAEEAENETILVKGIGMNSPEMRDAKAQIKELQSNLDRIKKENNDLYNRIAKLTDPEKNLKKARESGL